METFSNKKPQSFKLIAVLLIIASLSLGAYISTSKEIKLTVDFNTTNITTYANTVEQVLYQENITLDKDAYISPSLDTELKPGMKIEIKSPRDYKLIADGKEIEIKSVHTNTKEILEDIDFVLGEKDYTFPSLESNVRLHGDIKVIRVKELIEDREDIIPFKEETSDSDQVDKGTTKVVQEGVNGVKKSKVKKVYENDELVVEQVLSSEVIKEPVTKITHNGTRVKPTLNTGSGNVEIKKTITMNASAYDNSPQSQGKWVGKTATGIKPRVGVVAVDPRVIPLGSKLYIESLDGSKDYGHAVAGDTGGAIKGNRIDLFFNTRGEVMNFGRRQVKVHILN